MRTLLSLVLILSHLLTITARPVWAADSWKLLSDQGGGRFASEYFLKNYPDEALFPVRLLGGVANPGVYNVPKGMDLMTLISLSGGLIPDADTDDIRIKRTKGNEVFTVDLEDLVTEPTAPSPELMAEDIVFIKKKEPLVSSNTLATVGLVSSVVGIILSAVLVSRELGN